MPALLLFGLAFGCSEPATEKASPLHGDWKVVAMQSGHDSAQPDELRGMNWRIKDAEIIASQPGESGTMSFKTNESSAHNEIDITAVEGGNRIGETDLGIYSLVGKRLTICLRNSDAAERGRPTQFTADDDCWLMSLERVSR
jgi:uncharacterized protein (TIGR03067 family)